MRILFCNIAWMKYYNGKTEDDSPSGGGSYVDEFEEAGEQYNFKPRNLYFEDAEEEDGDYCLGFIETMSTNGVDFNQLHIEKIDGCEQCEKEDFVEDVLVVYCATHESQRFTTVVGWYQHATVYRYLDEIEFEEDGEQPYNQLYSAIAKVENCCLLPVSERSKIVKWRVPRTKDNISYGFGRSNVWFAQEQKDNSNLSKYLNKLYSQIQNYNGENWIHKQ